MPLDVIGAGFGRTGTLSLKLALEELGFAPCYHMVETLDHPDHDALWLAIARGESNDWRAILGGYRATVDWPAVSLWRELIAANPKAKVILTVRDPEQWYESASATIFARMRTFADALARNNARSLDATRRGHMLMVKSIVADQSFGGSLERDNAIAVFKSHNDAVRRAIPAERLLVYESGEGWERLCTFLGVPVPSAPYPKVNTTDDFTARFPQRA